jgi:hypothetical protein
VLCVTVGDGKYTVKQDATGRLTALRYGEPWRDCCGDGLIYTLAAEVETLREELARVTHNDQAQRPGLTAGVERNKMKGKSNE